MLGDYRLQAVYYQVDLTNILKNFTLMAVKINNNKFKLKTLIIIGLMQINIINGKKKNTAHLFFGAIDD